MVYFLPVFTFIFSMSVPSALSLYLITSSGVGYLQQWLVLRQDQEEMLEIADEEDVTVTVKDTTKKVKAKTKTKKKSPQTKKKRRKKS